MELLKSLYEIHSPSNGEKKMKKFIKRWIAVNVPDAKVWAENGNVYVRRGFAETYPCVVAHTDQVQDRHGKDFMVLESNDILMGYSPSMHEQQGLGADDKNGIWVALKCLQKYDVIKCAFFYGEEVGCLGSSRADMTFFEDCRFCLQCDRRNASDLITTIGGYKIASDEFINATNAEAFGYVPTKGLMTDVETLKNNGMKCSALNISCGYYEPHTDYEFTVFSELENCLAFVENIIENCTDKYDFEDTSYALYTGGTKYWNDWYDWYDCEDDTKPTTKGTNDNHIDWDLYTEVYEAMYYEYGETGAFSLDWFKMTYASYFGYDVPEDIYQMAYNDVVYDYKLKDREKEIYYDKIDK